MTQINRSTAAVSTSTAWKATQADRSGFGFAFSAAGVLIVTLLSALVLIAVEVYVPAEARLSSYEAMAAVESGTVVQGINPDHILRAVDTSRLPVEEAPAF